MPVLKLEDNTKVSAKYTFQRGVHPPDNKHFTAKADVQRVYPQPGSLIVIPMSQHLGAPCQPVVEVKGDVTAGMVIGESDAFVSAPVHSPVNGVIKEIAPKPHPSGRKVLSVVITVGEEQPPPKEWQELPQAVDPKIFEPEQIVKAIRQAGLVGMGGAAFPTSVKLVQNPKKPVDTILLNGCECEPYLTSDDRLMQEAPSTIVVGLQLAMRAAGAQRGVIAIEDNKPDAISTLMNHIKNIDNVQLAICQTKYPQGGEKQLIQAVTGSTVPTGGLPLDVGVVVINVGTAASISWACTENRPVTERIVTLTGSGIMKPGNYMTPVGMLVSDLFEQAGGMTEEAEKVLMGGPMMGPATPRLDIPVLKGTSGITVMTKADISNEKETACIRCSRCVDYCPLGLVPTKIAHAVKARNMDMAMDYDLAACCECGCCAYVCPAQIPLLQYMRSGKVKLRALQEEARRREMESGGK